MEKHTLRSEINPFVDLLYSDYVNKVCRKADSIFAYGLRLGSDHRDEISVQLDVAEESDRISAHEFVHVLFADLLWSGRLKSSNESITLVVETSWFAEQNDLDRALVRTAILKKIGVRALPVVAAVEWGNEMGDAARDQNVIVVQDLSLDRQSWDAVLVATRLTTASEN